MIHLTPQQLSSYMDGELNEASTELVRRHMGACEECTLKFAQLEIQEDLLSKALVHDPGDEFFEKFTEDVAKQIPAAKGSSKPAPARPSSKNAPTTPLPSRLAMPRRTPEPTAPARPVEPVPAAASSALEPEETAMGASDGGTNDWTSTIDADEELVGAAETPTRDTETSRVVQPVDVSDSVHAAESMAATDPVGSPDSPRAFDGPHGAGSDSPAADPPSRPLERTSRAVERPTPRPKAPQPQRPARPRAHRPAPSIPWYAALILAAISASAGVMVSRTEPVSAWLDSMAPRAKSAPGYPTPSDASPTQAPSPAPSQAPTEEMVPAPSKPAALTAKTSTTAPKASEASAKGTDASTKTADDSPSVDDEAMDPELTSTSDDQASGGPDIPDIQPQEASRFLPTDAAPGRGGGNGKDPYASVSPSALAVVRAAQKSVTAADTDPSATRYESAAADWEHAIPLLRGWQQSLGRFELASARYRAWEMAPTTSRATTATAAIRTYMASAAQGPARDQARAWMARLAP